MTRLWAAAPSLSPGSIRASDVVLDYPCYHNLLSDRIRTIVGWAVPFVRPPMKRVLNGLSFSIKPGEFVGIVGQNGTGKTSLLKIISGLLSPDQGTVEVGGRVIALFTTGVGIRPTLTGRENILYWSMLYGMTSREIGALLPEIMAFSELEEALEQPYFTYSSGMRSRLAFAFATHVPADVLILDETLAAGDAAFVAKCYARLRRLMQSGSTILVVSHHLGELARLASRVIVLDRGAVAYDGEVFNGLRCYEGILARRVMAQAAAPSSLHGLSPKVRFLDPGGKDMLRAQVGEPLTVELDIDSRTDLGRVFVVLRLTHVERGQFVSYLMPSRWEILNHDGARGDDNIRVGAGRTRVRWAIPQWVAGEGTYSCDVYLGPATDIVDLDMTRGHLWTSVARVIAGYDNCYMKGTSTCLEFPVAKVTVESEPAGIGESRSGPSSVEPHGQG